MTLRGYGGLSSRAVWVAVMTVPTDGQLSFNDFVSRTRKAGYIDDPSGYEHPPCGGDPPAGDPPAPQQTVERHHTPTATTTTLGSARPRTASTSPRLPGPGDLLNPRDGYVIAPVRLEPGSRVVGPPMVSCDFHGGHASVIEITGSVADVFEAYARQFADAATQASIWKTTNHGVVVRTATAGMGGGDAWVLTVVEQAHRRTYGLIQTTTDA
jgi:hypothetical protein